MFLFFWVHWILSSNTRSHRRVSLQAPAPVAFPMTTPQVPVYGMVKTTLCPLTRSSSPLKWSVHPLQLPSRPSSDQLPPQMSHQMGGVPMMPPQPVMYNQPVLRPTNPFGPIPGTQVPHTPHTHWCPLVCVVEKNKGTSS